MEKLFISKYTKLRISNHRLNIKQGRYAKTPVHLRTCNICKSLKLDNEFRFIFVCDKYDDLRRCYLMRLLKLLSTLIYYLQEITLLLLISQQIDIDSLVINYINQCFETRAKHHEQ